MKRDRWKQQLEEHPGRPQGRQHRQFEVLVALADQVNGNTGEGAVSVAELAKITGASDRTVKRALQWARAAGLLDRTSRGHHLGDGTTSASGWRLLGKTEPQGVTPPPQSANPRSQGANSSRQRASTAKAPGKRSSAKRSRGGGTYTPPQAQQILGRHWCVDCGFALDAHLAAAGITVHPWCTDPLDSTPEE